MIDIENIRVMMRDHSEKMKEKRKSIQEVDRLSQNQSKLDNLQNILI
jgi:hypothetical protein